MGKITPPKNIYIANSKIPNSGRGVFAAKDIKKGEVITEDHVKSIRPGFGLHPKYYHTILGQKVNCDLEKGTRMQLDFITNFTNDEK